MDKTSPATATVTRTAMATATVMVRRTAIHLTVGARVNRVKRSAGDRRRSAPLETRLSYLLDAARSMVDGDFDMRLPLAEDGSLIDEISRSLNELNARHQEMTSEIVRVERVVGREGRMEERARLDGARGGWRTKIDTINQIVADLVTPTTEISRLVGAVARGDLTQKMALEIEGQPVKGEFLRIGTTVNTMVDQLSSFAAEVTRVAKEVGTEGKLGGQADVSGVSGTWKDLTDNVNVLATNLTTRCATSPRSPPRSPAAISQEDHRRRQGRVLELKNTINTMVDSSTRSPPRSRASRKKSAPKASSAARPTSKASPARGRTSPTTSTSWPRT